MKPYYEKDGIVIYHGDCREVLPHLPKVDLVLTDPPYGIGADKGKPHKPADSGFYDIAFRRSYPDGWDVRPDGDLLRSAIEMGKDAVVWGGNFFASDLPQSKAWLVWNKLNTMPSFGDCELAWTTLARNACKMFTLSGNGLLADEKDRVHPTQKPVKLMGWCLSFFPDVHTILDPFMGSGTTLVAAKQLGRKAIGIEIEEKYCEIAVKRLAQDVFDFSEPEPEPKQESLI